LERAGWREEETLNTIKTTVKIAGFLLVVLLALGCGGSMPGSSSSSNLPTVSTCKFAGTEAIGGSGYRIDGLRGDFSPVLPAGFATNSAGLTPHSLSSGLKSLQIRVQRLRVHILVVGKILRRTCDQFRDSNFEL